MTTTTALIAEARALDAEATKEPWGFGARHRGLAVINVWDSYEELIASVPAGSHAYADADFIARARTLLPQLADALEAQKAISVALMRSENELQARLAKAEAILREVAKCDHPVYREPAQEYFDGPARPMEPGT